MRRMYSEKELAEIIKEVFDEEVESGVFDEDIADCVDAYLVEHPVDPTAITGLDIAPKDVTASGNITGASIIENMNGYTAELNPESITDHTITNIFTGVVKNGNKLTFVSFVKVQRHTGATNNRVSIARFTIPSAVGDKLYPYSISGYTNMLDIRNTLAVAGISDTQSITAYVLKSSSTTVDMAGILNSLTAETDYLIRFEITFLLSNNLISE